MKRMVYAKFLLAVVAGVLVIGVGKVDAVTRVVADTDETHDKQLTDINFSVERITFLKQQEALHLVPWNITQIQLNLKTFVMQQYRELDKVVKLCQTLNNDLNIKWANIALPLLYKAVINCFTAFEYVPQDERERNHVRNQRAIMESLYSDLQRAMQASHLEAQDTARTTLNESEATEHATLQEKFQEGIRGINVILEERAIQQRLANEQRAAEEASTRTDIEESQQAEFNAMLNQTRQAEDRYHTAQLLDASVEKINDLCEEIRKSEHGTSKDHLKRASNILNTFFNSARADDTTVPLKAKAMYDALYNAMNFHQLKKMKHSSAKEFMECIEKLKDKIDPSELRTSKPLP